MLGTPIAPLADGQPVPAAYTGPVSFVQLAESRGYYNYDSPQYPATLTTVASNATELLSLWNGLKLAGNPPAVNFNTTIVVGIGQATNCANVQLRLVSATLDSSDNLTVTYRTEPPYICLMAMSSVGTVVAINARPTSVTFVRAPSV